MASALNHNELYPLVADSFDYVGYVADFATDSFEKMLNNPEFVRLTGTVPVIIAHPFAPIKGELSVKIRERIDLDKVHALCARAAKMGVGFDINLCFYSVPADNYRNDPMVAIMKAAKEEGIRFSLGEHPPCRGHLRGDRRYRRRLGGHRKITNRQGTVA